MLMLMLMLMLKHWGIFTAAPHRIFFFAGVMQAIFAILWWLIDIGGRHAGFYAPVSWHISPVDAHAFLMIYGFFPFFIFGFLMTTYPRWMNGEEVERRAYVLSFLLLTTGISLFYAGLIVGFGMLRIALAVFLAGWALGLYALLRVYLRAKHPDKRHAAITSVVLFLGWLLIAGFASNDVRFVALAKVGGIWILLLPVFFAVSHRMIPFFSANVIPNYTIIRPDWALALMPTCALLHGILELSDLQHWTWLVDLPMAACALYLSRAWGLRESLAVPILAMLHIGFAWLGIALLLYSVQGLTLLISGQLVLAKAPLHALTLGYFTSMMLAMVTRVTLGHSGRRLVVDRLIWGVFLTFQSVALLRIMAELPLIGLTLRSYLYFCAALLWLFCFSVWTWKFGLIYWRPRSDGNPG